MLCGAVMPTGEQNIFALVKIFPGGSAARTSIRASITLMEA